MFKTYLQIFEKGRGIMFGFCNTMRSDVDRWAFGTVDRGLQEVNLTLKGRMCRQGALRQQKTTSNGDHRV